MEEAIHVITDGITKETEAFGNAEVKALFDYFLSTLLRHYHLYLFCMTREQELDQRMSGLEIEAPFVPEQLSKAMAIDKWNYEQSLKKIEEDREKQQTVCGRFFSVTYDVHRPRKIDSCMCASKCMFVFVSVLVYVRMGNTLQKCCCALSNVKG